MQFLLITLHMEPYFMQDSVVVAWSVSSQGTCPAVVHLTSHLLLWHMHMEKLNSINYAYLNSMFTEVGQLLLACSV